MPETAYGEQACADINDNDQMDRLTARSGLQRSSYAGPFVGTESVQGRSGGTSAGSI